VAVAMAMAVVAEPGRALQTTQCRGAGTRVDLGDANLDDVASVLALELKSHRKLPDINRTFLRVAIANRIIE
jgi:hypothetical protein